MSAAAAAQPADDEIGVETLQVEEGIFLGVLPRHQEIAELTHGYDVVVDLRFPYEGAYNELAALRQSPIQYFNVPTSSSYPTAKNLDSLEGILEEHRGAKILIHDSNGHRSAAIWAAHLVHLGKSVDEAVSVVESFFASEEVRPKVEHYLRENPLPAN